MKKFKNQKGAISLFVILAMLFFMAFMMGVYSITSRRNAAQLEAVRETAKVYASGVDAGTAYDSMLSITSGSIVPISTIEQLENLRQITEEGAPEANYTINGKLYTYKKYDPPPDDATKANITYVLNNDIILDLETAVNGNAKNLQIYDYMLYDKTNYNITPNNHNIYYRLKEDGSLWKCVFYQNTYKTDADYDADGGANSSGRENNFVNAAKDNAKSSYQPRLYSILEGGLSSYRITNSNSYEFLLAYNCSETREFNITKKLYNRWAQNNDPTKETETTTAVGDAEAAGYSPIHIGLNDPAKTNQENQYWGGLTLSSSASCYLDGSVGHGYWYFAVGTISNWGKYGTPISEYVYTPTSSADVGYKAETSANQTLLLVRAK